MTDLSLKYGIFEGQLLDSFGCQVHQAFDKATQEPRQVLQLNLSQESFTTVEQEAKALIAELKHQNLVQYLDVFSDHPASCFIVAEKFHGYNLGDYVQAQKSLQDVRTDELRILNWLLQLSGALAEIHRKGVIHRALEPKNVFLSEDHDQIKMGNFGLSVFVQDIERCHRSGLVNYMSPELIKDSSTQNQNSDCWSFGCIMFELFNLKRAFERLPINQADSLPVEVPSLVAKESKRQDYADYDPIYQKAMELDFNKRISSSEMVSLLKDLKSRLVLDQANVRGYLKLREFNKYNSASQQQQYKLLDPDVFQVYSKSTFAKIGFQELNLAGNRLRFLHQDSVFKGLTYLRKVSFFNNKLEHLHPKLLAPLANLQDLNLAKNELTVLSPKMFESLVNLRKLNLAHNGLSKLDAEAFIGLKSLLVLNLSNNLIESLGDGVFSGLGGSLEELILQENRIKSTQHLFDGLVKLLTLFLNGNCIQALLDSSFKDLAGLRELYLNRNQINRIESRTFENLKLLKVLNLKENSLRTLPRSLLDNLANVEILDLEGNQLSLLDYSHVTDTVAMQESVFNPKLTMIKSLNLAKNYQAPVARPFQLSDWALMTNLTDLDMRWCSIDSAHLAMLSKLSSVQNLILTHNNIEKVESSTFQSLRSLKTLNLNKNKIAFIGPNAFQSQTELVELTLANNLIESIDSSAFKALKLLTKLDLGTNRLPTETIIVDLLSSMTGLESLFLNNNQIKSLGDAADSNPFTRLINLKELHLGRNQIAAIDQHAFRTLRGLKVLNLQGNQIKSIEPTTVFKGLSRLEELYLDGSKLQRSNVNDIKEFFKNRTIRLEFDLFSDLLEDMNQRVVI